MITLFTLTTHILFGLIGVISSMVVLFAILGKKYKYKTALISSIVAFSGYLLSWILGGWYYVTFYGSAVKPIIKSGPYPWAHSIIMESKEHIFLMLPILAGVLAVAVWRHAGKRSASTSALAILVAVIAIFVLLTGIVVSGAVQR